MNQRVHLEKKHCSKHMPQIKEEGRECCPGEPAPRNALQRGRETREQWLGRCWGEGAGLTQGLLGHAWRWGGMGLPPHLHVEKNQR